MNNMLQPGDYAPLFQNVDPNGNMISLEAYRGRKLLLAFSQRCLCPMQSEGAPVYSAISSVAAASSGCHLRF